LVRLRRSDRWTELVRQFDVLVVSAVDLGDNAKSNEEKVAGNEKPNNQKRIGGIWPGIDQGSESL
jgi:hypothetical protein